MKAAAPIKKQKIAAKVDVPSSAKKSTAKKAWLANLWTD